LGDIIYSVVPNSVNDYVNLNIANNLMMSPAQVTFVDFILKGIHSNTIDSLASFFDNVDEQIAQSECIPTIDKTALYASSAIARASYDYWLGVINTVGHAGWTGFLSSNDAINYANLPFWVSTSFVSALSGFAQGQSVNMGVAEILNTLGRTLGLPLALGAAIGVTTGKIIFKWAQKPVGSSGCGH
jgi:hypothetical protein